MAKLNTSKKTEHVTHEGAPAKMINPEMQLRRSVMSCLLWENTFYEGGEEIGERIKTLVHANKPETVAAISIEARENMKLRHVPLLLTRELARHKGIDSKNRSLIGSTLERIIQRADELSEFLAVYWKDGKDKLSGQVKKGLAKAFVKFSAYDLAKYNRDGAIKLRDVLFLCHAKPKDSEQAETWKKLVDGKLESPDTWEVALSGGKDKKETWERLIAENKLGGLAFLRNLRNMKLVGVSKTLMRQGFANINAERVLPFRFISAARFAPEFEPEIEALLFKSIGNIEKIGGRTILLIDVSGSMDAMLSDKSQVNRIDAACGIAMIAREMFSDVEVYTFSNSLVQVAPRRGFALRDAIHKSQDHGGTELGKAVAAINKTEYRRLIVFTDEQSADSVPNPTGNGYMVNVAAYKNGIGYGKWIHMDGFSEAIISYILEYEKS